MFDYTSIRNHAKAYAEQAAHFLDHEFDILGSGWRRVAHGRKAEGFEGHAYSDSDATYEDTVSALPASRQARAAERLAEARRWRPDYIPLDWHSDLKSGYRSALVHHTRLTYGTVPGVDMKTTADLNRLYHLPALAMAWRATGRREFRDEAMAQFLDWSGQNPVEIGPAWRATMNVAIRAANMCILADLLRDSPESDSPAEASFYECLSESLLEHRRYISRYLEFPEGHYHPNHYIANLAGLLLASVHLVRTDPDAAAWRGIALREIRREMQRQILPDGFDYEAATSYHALVLEMLAGALVLAAKKEGSESPAEARDWIQTQAGAESLGRLEAMFRALRVIHQPNGLIPLVGDNDSGRFLTLEAPGHDSRDWRFLCGLGAALFESPDLAVAGPKEASSMARLVFGSEAGRVRESKKGAAESVAFRDVGFYVLRSSDVFSLVSAGPIGTGGIGGHAHGDKLAFTLCIAGAEFLVDPGVYVYTASRDWRDWFRSTLSHTTVCLDGQEQNRPNPASPWWGCQEDTRCRGTRWEVTETHVDFEGEHHGYERLDPAVLHRRRVRLDKTAGALHLVDRLVSADADEPLPRARWTFVLHPDCTVTVEGRRANIRNGRVSLVVDASRDGFAVEDGWVSPAYGIKQPTRMLVLDDPTPQRETRFVFRWDT